MYSKPELQTILNLLSQTTVKGKENAIVLVEMINKTEKMIEESKEE